MSFCVQNQMTSATATTQADSFDLGEPRGLEKEFATLEGEGRIEQELRALVAELAVEGAPFTVELAGCTLAVLDTVEPGHDAVLGHPQPANLEDPAAGDRGQVVVEQPDPRLSRPEFVGLRDRVRRTTLPLFAHWGLWHDDASIKPEAVRPVSWIIARAPEPAAPAGAAS